jgi:predicted dehydrogenase
MHAEVVVAFAAQGYDILCEKPLATSVEDCLQIEEAVKKAGIIFGLGHGAPPPCSLVTRAPLTICCIH